MRPGHENLIAMSAVNTIADEAIRDVSPGKRNCYFQDEYKLEMYSLYSQSGCIFECKMRLGKAKTVGGCTPWFYPSKDTNMCDPWQTQMFLSAVLDGGAGQSSLCLSAGELPLSSQDLRPLSARLRQHRLLQLSVGHPPQAVRHQEHRPDLPLQI